MYSIGQFSTITQLTVKALRLYHERDILVPSHIDEETGYRYYSAHDIEKARAIAHLKEMMFSLAEIKQVMYEYADEADLVDFLRAKQRDLLDRMRHLKRASASLDRIIQSELEARHMNEKAQFSIEQKQVTEQLVISKRWRGPYTDIGKVFRVLYGAAGRWAAGNGFNLYYDGEHREHDADIETCLPLKKKLDKALPEGCEIKTLPGVDVISLLHKGSYDTLGTPYATLFDYIEGHDDCAVSLPTREIYVKGPGMLLKGNPDKYLTEIQIPIASEN